MKLGDFMKMYADKDEPHCISVWEMEVKTGEWLGLFPVDKIPKEYAERQIEKFGVCEDCSPYDNLPSIWVVIK